MGRRPAFGMLVLVAAIVIPAGGPAWAAKAPAKATQDAAVSTLLEDLDGLNAKVNSQAQEIDALKKRVSEAEARQADGMAGLESRLAPRAELEPVRQDVATIRKDVDGLRNRADAWFHPSLELRVRPEYKVNHRDLDSDIADGDFFVRQRTRLGLSFKPVAWVEAVLMIQDMRCWGQEVSTKSNEKNLDLFQGYVRLSDLFVPGLSVQLGRMEMAFGAERQVSRNNFTAGRAFDGVRIAYDRPQVIRADLFATVVKDAGVPAGHDVNFYGLYLASNAWSFLDAELYGMYLENGTEGAAEFIGTVGVRAVARPITGLLIEGEAALQFGTRDLMTSGGSLLRADHLATAYAAQVLYEIPVTTRPTLGLVFYSASGDADPNDHRNVAYRPLFNTQHSILGHMDFFDWQGVWDMGGTARFEPLPDLRFRMDYHRFYLSSDGGTLAAFDGQATFPSGEGRYVGQELDFVLSFKAHEYLSFEGGYAFFLPGALLRLTRVARSNGTMMMGDEVSHWAYVQGLVAF